MTDKELETREDKSDRKITAREATAAFTFGLLTQVEFLACFFIVRRWKPLRTLKRRVLDDAGRLHPGASRMYRILEWPRFQAAEKKLVEKSTELMSKPVINQIPRLIKDTPENITYAVVEASIGYYVLVIPLFIPFNLIVVRSLWEQNKELSEEQ